MTELLNTIKMYFVWLKFEFLGFFSFRKASESTKNRVGLISFRLPPQFDSGTHRPLSFLQYAEENEWNITAITNSPDKPIIDAGKELAERLPKDVKIVEVENDLHPTSWRFTPRLDGGLSTAFSLASRAYKEFKHNPPDVIFASGPPFCFCIAGFFVARALNIPLVLDYRDEWTLCPFSFASKFKMDKWFEKRLVKHADKILYTTDSHLLQHQEHFSIKADKQDVVFNGWEDKSFNSSEVVKATSDEKIKISFIGRLNEMVSVIPFLSTLEACMVKYPDLAEKVEVEFVGEKSPELLKELQIFLDQDLHFKLITTPMVSKSRALELMQQSDYLLMLCGTKIAGYIQGKLYDYLSRNVPVIGFGHPGEVPTIIQKYNAGHFIRDDDIDGLANALRSSKPNLASNEDLQAWLQTRTRRQQAKRMYSILNAVMK